MGLAVLRSGRPVLPVMRAHCSLAPRWSSLHVCAGTLIALDACHRHSCGGAPEAYLHPSIGEDGGQHILHDLVLGWIRRKHNELLYWGIQVPSGGEEGRRRFSACQIGPEKKAAPVGRAFLIHVDMTIEKKKKKRHAQTQRTRAVPRSGGPSIYRRPRAIPQRVLCHPAGIS